MNILNIKDYLLLLLQVSIYNQAFYVVVIPHYHATKEYIHQQMNLKEDSYV